MYMPSKISLFNNKSSHMLVAGKPFTIDYFRHTRHKSEIKSLTALILTNQLVASRRDPTKLTS